MLKFEVGKKYKHNFITNSDLWVTWVVLKRTAKTITIQDVRDVNDVVRRRIKSDKDTEYVLPFGSYSMAPTLRASRSI